MDCTALADHVAALLERAIQDLPNDFYASFRYTQTGNNLTHPITWGILADVVRQLPSVGHVAIDLRLNEKGGIKFQPDIVALRADNTPMAFVDYESPNSSDARILAKDVDPFTIWQQRTGNSAPYIIVTTLPKCRVANWELRYTSQGKCNSAFRGRREELRENPFAFWYDHYFEELSQRGVERVALVNIDIKSVRREYPVAEYPGAAPDRGGR